MILVSELKDGFTIRLEDRLYRVLEVLRHTGSGQMHGFVELKLKDLRFGHFADRRFKQSDRVESVELAKRQMSFIYSDSDSCYFMDELTFEQIAIPRETVGKIEKMLEEETKVSVELLGEEPVAVQFPKVVELAVASTGPGLHDGQDNTMKPATLENGIDILVPQFIQSGDHIRIDTERMKYIDRVIHKKTESRQ
ncbi:MAG TPA: elongation factor P [Bacteroidota bacterium]|nr:elongation factor P [Bacteroidota bacterium]